MTTALVWRTPERIPPFLDDAEAARVLDGAQTRWQGESRPCRRFQAHRDLALVLTLFHAGLRIGEACRLMQKWFGTPQRWRAIVRAAWASFLAILFPPVPTHVRT
jgi:integrase